ncbi:MAG: beta-ketoacyl-[acyl-carrier-protein] synthase family protein [Candidatus Omnitrophota bacterium]|nr:MAG: beta-ketoacyl-[acyl-carrier-protein] synthase family protein [Candidatus Omnitrophota bacterium]
MNTRIAVTGIGVISPAGLKKETFWANLKASRSFVDEIKRFDASLYPSRIAGQIHELDAYSHLSSRLLKKIDVFSHMALVASEEAIKDAKLDLDAVDKQRVGAFMGNALGGWLFAETELRDMYLEGREGISPYMASAWFPAAPQGQITIYYGLKGYSKTVVADKASSALAVWYGAKVLKDRKNDFVLAGGMEAPVTPYALLCANTNGSLSKNNTNPRSAYRPYDLYRDGFVIGEGSGIVLLERENDAQKRGVHIHGFIKGVGFSCDGVHRIRYSLNTDALEFALRQCLDDCGWQKDDIDYICLDAEATVASDAAEAKALKGVFGSFLKNIALSAPKSMFGNLLGAQTSLDLIATLLSLQHNLVLPTINFEEKDPYCDIDCTPNHAVKREMQRALIISRGRGGINVVLGVEKGQSNKAVTYGT